MKEGPAAFGTHTCWQAATASTCQPCIASAQPCPSSHASRPLTPMLDPLSTLAHIKHMSVSHICHGHPSSGPSHYPRSTLTSAITHLALLPLPIRHHSHLPPPARAQSLRPVCGSLLTVPHTAIHAQEPNLEVHAACSRFECDWPRTQPVITYVNMSACSLRLGAELKCGAEQLPY